MRNPHKCWRISLRTNTAKLLILRAATATNQKAGSSNLSGRTIHSSSRRQFSENHDEPRLNGFRSIGLPADLRCVAHAGEHAAHVGKAFDHTWHWIVLVDLVLKIHITGILDGDQCGK